MKVAVIGSGIGGLAIAIRLKKKGHDVTIYEKNGKPGGKIDEIRTQDYRFDSGPSLLTLPKLVEELFDLCGESMETWLPISKLKINCKYFFSDGKVFNFYDDKNLLFDEVNSKTLDKFDTVCKRLKKSKEAYELSAPVFLFRPFASRLSDFNTPPYKKVAKNLFKLDFLRTMNQCNKKDFKDPNMVQLFDRYATYNGSNPYRAPATLNMIAHLENNIGAYFPFKGMYSIVESLYNLALKMGVKFNFNTLVTKIVTKEDRANAIIINDKIKKFDVIVSDVDARYVANNLIDNYPLKKRLNRSEPSSSALIFYWGIKKSFNDLDLHNILFSSDYKAEFDYIFNKKSIYNDPTIYIFISSKVVVGDAPLDSENWFVMINAPSNNGQYTDDYIKLVRENIIKKINTYLKTNIEKYIETEKIATPITIEKSTNSVNGALYGTSSNSIFSAFLRHPNYLKKLKNLYFVGGSVHPGGGIPLCLANAKIVDDEISFRYD